MKLCKKKKYGYGISVCINRENYDFLVDTGCQQSIIFYSMANKLQLAKKEIECIITDSSGSRSRVCNSVVINNLQIDAVNFESVQFLLINNNSMLWGKHFGGILGMDIFRKTNFTINFFEKTFCINGLSENDCGIEYMPIKVNDVETIAAFDTGSNVSWISNQSVFEGMPYKKKFLIQFSVNGIKLKRNKEYQNLILSGYNFQNQSCSILEGRSVMRSGFPIGIVIGLDILMDKKLVYQNGKWMLGTVQK